MSKRQIRYSEQLVEAPDDRDAYYKVTVTLRKRDGAFFAYIPGIGRCMVEKTYPQHAYEYESFAWKIVQKAKRKD